MHKTPYNNFEVILYIPCILSGCSLAPDCGLLGRESCSLSTPEHTCGPCLVRNTTQPGNSSCTNITVTTTVYYEYTTGTNTNLMRTIYYGNIQIAAIVVSHQPCIYIQL